MSKAKKPKIRFKGFTNDWEHKTLKDVSENFDYGINCPATNYDGVNKYIRITDIDDETHLFKTDDLTSPNYDLNIAEKYKLSTNDILFARTGASVGKTYIYKETDGIVYFAGFLIRAKILPSFIAKFIYQNTLTNRYNNFVKITSQRSGQPGINAQEYGTFFINIPQKEEQSSIATLFDKIDKLITLHQRKCEKLQNIKKSLLEKMFPKNTEKFPAIRFKGFTNAWEQQHKLKDYSKLITKGTTPMDRSGKGIINFIKVENIIGNKIVPIQKITKQEHEGYLRRSKLKINDILFSIAGTLGRCAIVDKSILPANINQALAIIRGYNFDTKFLIAILSGNIITEYIKKNPTVGAQPNLSLEQIGNIVIRTPSWKEQIILGRFFKTLDRLITLHQRQVEKLQNIKKALLEKMFV